MYVDSLYMIYTCIYMVYTCLYTVYPCLSHFIILKMQALCQPQDLLKQLVIPCTDIVYTCTYIVYALYIWYFPLQTRLYSLQEAIYSAIVQELAILYIACSDRYIHCKNSSVQVVSFPGPFLPFLPYSCPDITQHGTAADRRWQTLLGTFWNKFPESWPPGQSYSYRVYTSLNRLYTELLIPVR